MTCKEGARVLLTPIDPYCLLANAPVGQSVTYLIEELHACSSTADYPAYHVTSGPHPASEVGILSCFCVSRLAGFAQLTLQSLDVYSRLGDIQATSTLITPPPHLRACFSPAPLPINITASGALTRIKAPAHQHNVAWHTFRAPSLLLQGINRRIFRCLKNTIVHCHDHEVKRGCS